MQLLYLFLIIFYLSNFVVIQTNYIFIYTLSIFENICIILISIFFYNFKFLKKKCIYIVFILNNFSENILIYKDINILLLNGLFNIHPWIYIIIYIYITTIIFKLFFFKNNKIFFINYNFINKIIKIIIIYTVLFIILGSLWATQELSWGGWWTWDIIEIIILLFLINILVIYHMNNTLNVYIYKYCIYLYMYIFIFNKLAIINSIHNFIILNENNYIMYIFMLILVIELIYLNIFFFLFLLLLVFYFFLKIFLLFLLFFFLKNFKLQILLYNNVYIYSMTTIFFIFNIFKDKYHIFFIFFIFFIFKNSYLMPHYLKIYYYAILCNNQYLYNYNNLNLFFIYDFNLNIDYLNKNSIFLDFSKNLITCINEYHANTVIVVYIFFCNTRVYKNKPTTLF